jgi:anthranilate synthase component 1
MVITPIEAGAILPLVRELTGNPDPLELYRRFSDGGRRPGTFLLESAETGAGAGERSLIGVGAALRITCIGRRVIVEALSPNGRSLLPWIAEHLADYHPESAERPGGCHPESAERPGGCHPESAERSKGPILVSRKNGTLTADFPALPEIERDEAARARLLSPLDALRSVVFGPSLLAHPIDACHLAAGVFSYDLVELFETLPAGRPEPAETPHFEFVVPDRLIIVDHLRHRSLLVANAYGGAGSDANYHDAVRAIGDLMAAVEQATGDKQQATGNRQQAAGQFPKPQPPIPSPEFPVDLSDTEYAALVVRLKQHIVAGDVFQIVASRTFTAPCPDPLAAYARLRLANPSPYLFYVAGRDAVVFGASPETAVKVHGSPRRVTIRPIAGTAARGRSASGAIDPDLDSRREAALHLDEKETAEHMMLVDLARNDVARVSRPGTRRVTRLLTVDRYAHVMHLVSEVEGTLAEGQDALHAYTAAMNMGTLVGAPKLRAAQILREVETSRRGAYGGAVGYLSRDGAMDTAIVIRAAVVRNGTAQVRAGAGIVFDSDPAEEARETRRKAEAVLRAIAGGSDV